MGPAPEYTFTLFSAAVGSYFKGGFVKPVSLLVDYHFHRAAPGGVGWVKAAGNYSQVSRVYMLGWDFNKLGLILLMRVSI